MATGDTRVTCKNSIVTLALVTLYLSPGSAWGVERLSFKPGFNLFSPQQDVQVGREASTEAEKQMPLVTDPAVVHYVNDLGGRLASFAPNNQGYAWTFKVVNSGDINAFALPGGYIYVNRGAIEAAEDEAQIAGVIAHESGHVVMRHGTHMASQQMLAQAPLAILGGFFGNNTSLLGQLAQYGISFGVNSLFLKNSRSAESQADEVGTYVLYQSGYDPHAMAQFFETIEKKYPQRTMQFFSDHPNPENRIKDVDALIPQLGPAKQWKTDNPDFQAVKKRLLAMPAPPKPKPASTSSASPSSPPPAPSARLVSYQGKGFTISYPDNWKVQEGESGVAIAPQGGFLQNSSGDSAQAYGASISRYQPSTTAGSQWGLVDATQELLDSFHQSNPNMRAVKQTGIKISGMPALRTDLQNDSPLQGENEQDVVVTARQDQSLLAVILVAPGSSFETYRPTFDAMLNSLTIR